MARIISLCNAKGGTGKTTASVNLASCLAIQHGKRVLGIDLDAQGNFGIALGLDPRNLQRTTFHLLTDEAPRTQDYIVNIQQNLDLIPNAISIELENRLESSHNRESILKLRLKSIRNQYDYIIIDTPPAMRTPTMNAIVAADEIIIVVDCGYFALYGLVDLMKQIAKAQDAHEKDTLIIRGLLNLYNKTQKLDQDVKKEVADFFGPLMLQTVVNKNVRLVEATSAHQPIIVYDRTASGAFDFIKLSKELLNEHEPEQKTRSSARVK
jgi:chromosome partitioning protein